MTVDFLLIANPFFSYITLRLYDSIWVFQKIQKKNTQLNTKLNKMARDRSEKQLEGEEEREKRLEKFNQLAIHTAEADVTKWIFHKV